MSESGDRHSLRDLPPAAGDAVPAQHRGEAAIPARQRRRHPRLLPQELHREGLRPLPPGAGLCPVAGFQRIKNEGNSVFSMVNSFVGVWMFHVVTGFCWRRVSSRSEGTRRRGRASLTTTLSAVTGGTRPGIVDPAVVTKQARRQRTKIYRICTGTERITHVDMGRIKCYILCIRDY
jgi:hypothetical protein